MKIYKLEVWWKELGYRRYYSDDPDTESVALAMVLYYGMASRYVMSLTDRTELPSF
jgi:hypothetical protein